ncbi:MAG TPA: 2,3-bisphosphoglycerate-independent phosphoglycerate mutase [Gemmatimonadales bacterium]|nr:2,3-bisphosphoglycerate-independent phosphoglycerate mutase [Gemmatimonadales bacterium]
MSNGRTSGPPTPVALVVLDGWGYREGREGNAIELGRTPVWHRLWAAAPRTLLDASGLAVGLPEGQMGNSEVGHLNLGAGRVVPQDLVRISRSIETGEFFRLPAFLGLGAHLKTTGGTLHLLGLVGDGGVHAIDTHLLACVELGKRLEAARIAVHGFLDGRDTPPTSAAGFVAKLGDDLRRIAGPRAAIASLVGRYFAMDRDKRWDRTRLAYDLLVRGRGTPATDPAQAVRDAYARGETDEFVKPIVLLRDGAPLATLRSGDGVLCFNYRSDRMRQIVRALAIEGFDGFPVPDRPSLAVVTMTQYDATFPLPQAFPPFSLARILAEQLADVGRTQFHTAETEKYAHVTYFFNGGREPPYRGEDRVLVPSPRVATYDLAPEMSAPGVTEALCCALDRKEHDFLLCNFANPDMVGHTGVLAAVIKAVETVDECLGRIVERCEASGTRLVVTADHGNCEVMIDPETGGPHTAHTSNPVPFVAVNSEVRGLRARGALCDVAPTILALLGLEQPREMTGRALHES